MLVFVILRFGVVEEFELDEIEDFYLFVAVFLFISDLILGDIFERILLVRVRRRERV